MATILIHANYTVNATQTLNFTTEAAFNFADDAGSAWLYNYGTINVSSAEIGIGAYWCSTGSLFWNKPGATFKLTGYGRAYGYYCDYGGAAVHNSGTFIVDSIYDATGVDNWTTDTIFTNDGTFRVTAEHRAVGAQLENGGTYRNSGTIEVSGKDSAAGIAVTSYGCVVENSGTIKATGAGAAAIAIDADYSEALTTITNSGVIEGGTAIREVAVAADSSFVITNTGTITGAVLLGQMGDIVTNKGVIHGTVDLGAGDDSFVGTGGTLSGRLFGGLGSDLLIGGSGNDVIFGDTGSMADHNDSELAYNGSDSLYGGGGNDTLCGGGGSFDLLDGGAGSDTATYVDALGPVRVSLIIAGPQSTGGAGVDQLVSIENLTGSDFADTLTGNGAANVLLGGAGNDVLIGGGGNDRLDGSGGSDTASYAYASGGVHVNLGIAGSQSVGADQGSDILVSIENLTGSAFNDTLTGNSGANVLVGSAGNDVLNGAGGIDTVSYAAASSGVTVNLKSTTARLISAGEGSDTLISIESVIGSAYADTLRGGDGNDTLAGGTGNDVLLGGGGNDTLIGGYGNDVLSGESGSDTFRYLSAGDSTSTGYDTITGFDAKSDKIDLWGSVSGIDTTLNTGALSDATFNANLSSALGSKLAAHHAILFKPNSGTLSGNQFLVIDCNGKPGYQAGFDLVIRLVSPTNLGSLGVATFT